MGSSGLLRASGDLRRGAKTRRPALPEQLVSPWLPTRQVNTAFKKSVAPLDETSEGQPFEMWFKRNPRGKNAQIPGLSVSYLYPAKKLILGRLGSPQAAVPRPNLRALVGVSVSVYRSLTVEVHSIELA